VNARIHLPVNGIVALAFLRKDRTTKPWDQTARIIQSRYLNYMIEAGHRFIKRLTHPMLGFKAFHSGAAQLGKAKIAHMIRKGQFDQTGVSPGAEIAALTA